MEKRHFSKKNAVPHRGFTIRGVLNVNSRAVGFVEDERQKEDVLIETLNLHTALNRDEVEVELLKEKVRGRRTGKVIRIIKRAKMRFVGTIEEKTSLHAEYGGVPFSKRESRRISFVLMPDDFRMYAPIVIDSPFPKGSTRKGEGFKFSVAAGGDTSFKKGGIIGMKALVEIKEWKTGQEPKGEIIKIIGKKGEHEVEMESIVLERGFKSTFPKEVESEAEGIAMEARRLLAETGTPISKEEIKKRRDFRDLILFTIDPANAKDFDDALSFRKLPQSNVNGQKSTVIPTYEIGVHIADVSHYAREGTALDREARERGTSVYLVDRTIPMLPHTLSNDLCSLNPNVDRLAFSAVFEMDGNGRVHKRWFGKSVIHSKMRFTYESAQELIDLKHLPLSKGENERGLNVYNPPSIPPLEMGGGRELAEALKILNSIAKKLRAEKTQKGAIDFEQDEIGFELDEKGHPIRVFKKKRLDTHKLVEEFMLLANREVAHFFHQASRHSGGKTPFIYRTHDVPNFEKLEQLRIFVRALGHELPVRKGVGVTGKDLQVLFNAIEGHASESLIKTAAIRSMAKAVYSTQNIGHFGLAFEHYTHFTSPIRRYPDLLAHRLLLSILERHKFDPNKLVKLERMAEDATRKEISAAEAERESIKLKQVEYMEERLGKEFEGVISGVTEWGIYVEEKETRSEGMVKLRDLDGDYYVLKEQSYAIIGEKTKKKYALGDRVRFKIVGADVERKMLDYKLV